jgi:hypothetical protein
MTTAAAGKRKALRRPKAEGKYRGRPEDTGQRRDCFDAARRFVMDGDQDAFGCSRATIAKIAK